MTAGMLLLVLAITGCGQPGPDPQAEARQKVEADAMMKQYEVRNAPDEAGTVSPSEKETTSE